jgi:hypothetical protein
VYNHGIKQASIWRTVYCEYIAHILSKDGRLGILSEIFTDSPDVLTPLALMVIFHAPPEVVIPNKSHIHI